MTFDLYFDVGGCHGYLTFSDSYTIFIVSRPRLHAKWESSQTHIDVWFKCVQEFHGQLVGRKWVLEHEYDYSLTAT